MYERKPPKWPGWETKSAIGHGSFGAVYRIERDVFGVRETAALKHISIPSSESEIAELRSEGEDLDSITRTFRSQMEGFLTEYRLMRQLVNCPYVVRVDDVECVQHDDGIGWDILIKMELLTTLFNALGDKRITPESEVIRLGKDLCRALIECARFRILHRDIKPQNIFVSENGTYKLGDFGIARVKEQNSGTATARTGTYNYMAPEVYYGKRYGAAADIYSLGVVLYWLLNERRAPFVTDNTADSRSAALARRMSGETIPAPKHGSEGLKAIVLRACAYDPADRYAVAEELLADLEAVERGEQPAPAPVREEAPAPEPPRPAAETAADEETVVINRPPKAEPAKKKKVPILPLAALLICLGAGGWFLLRSGRLTPAAPNEPAAAAEPSPSPTTAATQTPAPTEKPSPIPETALTADFRDVKAGDTILFGHYEQNGVSDDGKEPVEWIVLAKENGRLLLLSKYALDCQPYHTKQTDVTWETCSLRKWLNSAFLETAFSEEEQDRIPAVTVSADWNPSHDISPGNDTSDRVFLLSTSEVTKYFTEGKACVCEPTTYALLQIVGKDDSGEGGYWWWLRTPGEGSDAAAVVNKDGYAYDFGRLVDYDIYAVRPAVWIESVPTEKSPVIVEGSWSYGAFTLRRPGGDSVYIELTDDRLPDGYPMSPTRGKNKPWWNVIIDFDLRHSLNLYINAEDSHTSFASLPTSLYLSDAAENKNTTFDPPKYTLRNNTFCVEIPLPEQFTPEDIQAVHVNLGTEQVDFSDHYTFYP